MRHHHDIGLLEQPQRHTNGYKQYGVAHLVRALRIKRLTDLGFYACNGYAPNSARS